MNADSMTIALISDVFHSSDGPQRLRDRLEQARDLGAELAVLPELPLNPWSPATKNMREDDAEPLDGPRTTAQRSAAAAVGIALVGGAIITDSQTKRRYNTALVINNRGDILNTWRKSHIPEEPGFWETSHYDAGLDVPNPIEGLPMPIGVQICSDLNRPEECHILAAAGAAVVVNPRATELATYQRWRSVFIANALTSACYIFSVNRPAPEQDVLIGGASFAFSPMNEVLIETTDPVAVATINQETLDKARIAYPGYLPVRAEIYARGWAMVAERNAHR